MSPRPDGACSQPAASDDRMMMQLPDQSTTYRRGNRKDFGGTRAYRRGPIRVADVGSVFKNPTDRATSQF